VGCSNYYTVIESGVNYYYQPDIPHIKVDKGYLILILDFGAGLSLLPARTKRFFIASPAILSVFLGYINSFIALGRNRRYLSLGSQEEVAF